MNKDPFQNVEEMAVELFQLIQYSQNQRIINSLLESQLQIFQSLDILKEFEEESKFLQSLLKQFKKLLEIARTNDNLVETPQKVWLAFKNKKYILQDKFIESIIYLAKFMKDQSNTYSITQTQYLKQECILLSNYLLITITFYFDNQQVYITYVAPQIMETKLFLVEIELQKLMQKFQNLEETLKYAKKNQQILKLSFDHSNQILKFWSNNEILSYQLTQRYINNQFEQLQQQNDEINYKIYLDVGMVIKLSPDFSLVIQDLNEQDYLQDELINEIQPIYLQKVNNNDNQYVNQRYIKINNGQKDTILSIPFNTSKKLRTYLDIPIEFEIYIFHNEKGYYLEIENKGTNYLPQLLSLRTNETMLKLKSKDKMFVLGIIILEYTNILMKIDMQTIWDGDGLFEV